MASIAPDPEELKALRLSLLKAGRRWGLGLQDVEDMVQEALLKVLRQGARPGGPPFRVRAFRALRDKQVEALRLWARRHDRGVHEVGADALETVPGPSGESDHVGLCDLLVRVAGSDAMAFAVLRAHGMTEADIASALGWPRSRAAAARVRLGRSKPRIVRELREKLPEKEE